MANMMFMTPNLSDPAAVALSNGKWLGRLPLGNLKDRRLHRKARSVDALATSTQFEADLTEEKLIRSVSLHAHNLSRDATVRVTGRNASIALDSLSAVTNLGSEYAAHLYAESDLRVAMPSNWDPNNWSIECWGIPDFDYDDGNNHVMIEIRLTGNDYVRLRKSTTNVIQATVVAGGSANTASLSYAFSAGDTIFVGARLHEEVLTLYVDTDGDNALETNENTLGGAVGTGSFTAYIGQAATLADDFEGAINLLVTNDGSTDDPIVDRFNAGAGMALEGADKWLARHGGHDDSRLVLHLGGNSDGTAVQVDTRQGATDLLAGTATGRLDFTGDVTEGVTYGTPTSLDAATKATFCYEYEEGSYGTNNLIWSSEGALASSAISIVVSDGWLYTYFGSGSNAIHSSAAAIVEGERRQILVSVDLGLTGTDRVKYWTRIVDSVGRYGTWIEVTSKGSAGTIPATIAANTSAAKTAFQASFVATLDDLRWIPGVAHDPTTDPESYFLIENVAREAWDHHYTFNGDADDQIGSDDGTVAVAGYVDDGRHHKGSFERWVQSGMYYGDGVDDDIDLGDVTVLDGATDFSIWGRVKIAALGAQEVIFSRDDVSNNRQVNVSKSSSDKLAIVLGTDTSGGVSSAAITLPGTPAVGDIYDYWIRYAGGGADNAARLKMGAAKHDLATGTPGALAEVAPTFAGTIPSALITPASPINAYFLRAGSLFGNIYIDDLRLNVDTALDVSTLNAVTVYERTDANWDHAWTFDGDADDQIASADGTISGAASAADGRQPEGWTEVTAGAVDRARGSHLLFTGSSGDFASIPYDASMEVTGALEVQFDWAPGDVVSGSFYSPVARWVATGNQRCWAVDVSTTGQVQINWSTDGSASALESTTALLSDIIVDGQRVQCKVTFNPNDGSGREFAVSYRYSEAQPWVLLEAPTTGAATSIFNSVTTPLEFGSLNGSTGELWAGKMFRVRFWDGLEQESGTKVIDADFTKLATGATSFTEDASGLTVSVNGSASIGVGGADQGDHRVRLSGARWDTASFSTTAEQWYQTNVIGRLVQGDPSYTISNGLGATFLGTIEARGSAWREGSNSTETVVLQSGAAGKEAYYDSVQAWELATVTPTAAVPGLIYDSGALPAYPEIYPAGVLAPGDPGYADNKLAQVDYDAGYRADFIHMIQFGTAPAFNNTTTVRYWSFEIVDTANPDGYVELGRLVMAYGYQPTTNMAEGGSLGWVTDSTRTNSDGGATFYDDRPRRRKFDFVLQRQEMDEALVRGFEFNRRLGTSEQMLLIYDPDDTVHMHRRSFLGTLNELSPLAVPYTLWGDQPFSFIEEL